MKSNELGYFAILCTAVVVARVSHASRLVFMRTLVCAISGEFSCDRLNRRFSCENIFEKYVGHNRKSLGCYGIVSQDIMYRSFIVHTKGFMVQQYSTRNHFNTLVHYRDTMYILMMFS